MSEKEVLLRGVAELTLMVERQADRISALERQVAQLKEWITTDPATTFVHRSARPCGQPEF